MVNPVAVTKFVIRSHSSPDELRSPDKTRVELVRLEGFTLGRYTLDPGWRWSESIKPVVKTDSCPLSHVGYAVSGHLHVRMNDGTTRAISPGDSYTIPPGHDAWVEGDEPYVGLEVLSADQLAKAAPHPPGRTYPPNYGAHLAGA